MISIIIPIYNQGHKLELCLKSIVDQTYDNYEIILVNDRSTQRLRSHVLPYKKELGVYMEILNNQTRHGAPYSRNKGFKKSKGEFVIFCDADVAMAPDCLEQMHNALKAHPEASYAYSSFRFGHKKFSSFDFNADRLKLMPYIHSTSLIRREHFPKAGWDESLRRMQDWDLWLQMLSEGHNGVRIDKVLFSVESGGTMSQWLPKLSYRLLPFLPAVRAYKDAVRVIKEKHGLL